MEVEHVFVLEADVAAEVLAHDALPGREKRLVEGLLELLCQVYVLELARSGHSLLHELDRLEAHIYPRKDKN